ncbi:MAG: ArnT family glycosyltransferase, partial [Elusimicrobiota bacterium]
MNKTIAALLVFSALVLVPFINTETNYTLPGEYRWTLPTVVDTYSSGELLVPHLWGNPRYRKPPIGYWLKVAFAKVFSLKLFWVRLPSVILGLLSVLWLFKFVKKTGKSRDTALTASLMLLGCAGFFSYSRIAALEIPMLFFTLGAFYFLYLFLIKNKTRALYAVAFFCALTLLVKSHATFISLLIFLLLWSVFFGFKNVFKGGWKTWSLAAIILLVTFLPWFLYLASAHTDAFIANMQRELVGDRFSFAKYNLHGLIKDFFIMLLPFSIIFIYGLYKSFKNRDVNSRFMLFSLISLFIPYIFIANQKMRYAVPFLPFAAAITVFNIEKETKIFKNLMKTSGFLFVFIPGILVLGLLVYFNLINAFQFIIALTALTACFLSFYKAKLIPATALSALVMMIFLGGIYSSIGLWKIDENVIEALEEKQFATLNRRPFFLPFKLGRTQDVDITEFKSFKEAAEMNALIYIAEHRMKRLERYMETAGYETYDIYLQWEVNFICFVSGGVHVSLQ